MKPLVILFLLLFIHPVIGQEEEPRYSAVAVEFMTAFNNEDYQAVFDRYDQVMRESLPLEQTRAVLGQQIRGTMGDILTMEFYRRQGPAHVYKTTFASGVLDILISLDGTDRINGLYFTPHQERQEQAAQVLERNTTPMRLPFDGEWFVFWGGETEARNYHMANKNQQYAYDLIKVANGASHTGDPLKNESYFAFGEPILAPCDATVVLAIDGVPDNVPGETNPIHLTGNTLVLETPSGEYILMAHLQEGSLKVGKGARVSRGEVLARCGNSGNSTEPHLHLQLQNTRDFHKATGARLYFHRLLANGEPRESYLPVKEDFIEHIE
ncbi:M23 family metallopeptidase [Robiginitalea marina]|uniref:M23 family metallopeptidase n=1 Tax=Robiginitalea marina TaxID=2954105 RepID=A0ABT1AZ08_9FLAO|nr:M23 family metallopeptidase [Robiginitalea marina]MCO5724919.1 M23 family metallopeptidase [Robiginitalea marina]